MMIKEDLKKKSRNRPEIRREKNGTSYKASENIEVKDTCKPALSLSNK